MLFDTDLTEVLMTSALMSAAISMVLIVTQKWHAFLTGDKSNGIQKVHSRTTIRVGGIGIFLGLGMGSYLLGGAASSLMLLLVISALPTWAIGLTEDITNAVSSRIRFVATMVSALLAIWLTGFALTRVDVPGADYLLSFTPIAVVFTVFAVAGLSHAINLIDGFNGLASGTVLICMGAFAWIAFEQRDIEVLQLILLVMAAIVGFFILNFPFGRIFLGDGGAYIIGLFLAWFAVMLSARHPVGVSPWAPVLICAYPILETLFSVYRRLQGSRRIDSPDRGHLHSLVYRRVVPRWWPNVHHKHRNALTTPLLWLFAAFPAILGAYWHDNTAACVAAVIGTCVAYLMLYRRLTRFKWL